MAGRKSALTARACGHIQMVESLVLHEALLVGNVAGKIITRGSAKQLKGKLKTSVEVKVKMNISVEAKEQEGSYNKCQS